MRKRPDPVPYQHEGILFLPSLNVNLSRWREYLKGQVFLRDEACRGCGEPFLEMPHLHEGIVSRAEVSGWPLKWRKLIHVEVNAILICRDCNLSLSGKSPPPRVQVWTEHCEIYGREIMVEWLDSLPFKIPKRF